MSQQKSRAAEPVTPATAPSSEVGRLVKGTFYTFSSFVLVKLIMAVNSVVVARMLTPNDLGILTILEQIHKVVLIFAYIGIPLALVKYISELAVSSSTEIKKYVGSATIIVAVSAGIFCIVYAFLRDAIASFYQVPILRELVLFSVVTTFVYALYETGNAVLRGYQRIKAFSTLNVVRWLIIVPVNIAFIKWFGLLGAVLSIMICSFINLVILLAVLRRGTPRLDVSLPGFSFDIKVLKRFMGYGVPAMISDALVIFPMWVALSYLSKQTDFVNVGYYRVSYSLTMIIMFIPMAIAVPIIPLFSELEKRDITKMEKFFRQSIRLTALVMIPVTAGLALFSKHLIPLLYGAEYFPAWHILFFFSAGLYFYSLTSIIGYLIAGTGKMWQGCLLNLIWTILYIVLSVVLIDRYGLIGFGIAYLLSYLLHTITSFIYLRIVFGIHMLNIRDVLFIGLIVYGVTYFLLTTAVLSDTAILIISIVAWIFMTFLCYRLLSRDEKRILYSLLNSIPFLKISQSNSN